MKPTALPRLLILAASAMLSAHAFSLTLNPAWPGGISRTITSSNGDTVSLMDPVVLDSGSSAADALATIVGNQPLWFGGNPVTVNRGAAWDGTVDLDRLRATTGFDSSSGRFFTGWDFAFRLQTGQPLGSDTRFVVITDDGTSNGNVFNEGFQAENELYYYSPTNEPNRRNVTNINGAGDYEFDSNLAFLAPPGTYTQRVSIFLVTEAVDAGGAVTLDVHDAVSFTGAYVQQPVPEPATLAAMGLGIAAMARRRRRAA